MLPPSGSIHPVLPAGQTSPKKLKKRSTVAAELRRTPEDPGARLFSALGKRPSIRDHGSRSPAIDQCTAVTTLSQPRTHGTRRRAPFFPPARTARPDRSSVPPDARRVLSPSALRATLHAFQQWPRGEHAALFRTPRSGSAVPPSCSAPKPKQPPPKRLRAEGFSFNRAHKKRPSAKTTFS